ncbi:MAG: hypothetical protein AB1439_07875 [candidate division FCPU426 bacterium]
MAQVKGTSLLHRFQVLEKNATPEQISRIIEKVAPDLRTAYLQKKILPIKWYPIGWLETLMIAADEVLGRGDLAYCVDLGRQVSAIAVKGIYKMFYKLSSVELIFKNAPMVWKQLFDVGLCQAVIPHKGEGRMTVSQFPDMPKSLCLSLLGWCEAVIEMAGGKNIRIKIEQWPGPETPLVLAANWE